MDHPIRQEELAALKAFAAEEGKEWKDTLTMVYWYNARIWRDHTGSTEYGTILHELRNNRGPEWLYNFKLPK